MRVPRSCAALLPTCWLFALFTQAMPALANISATALVPVVQAGVATVKSQAAVKAKVRVCRMKFYDAQAIHHACWNGKRCWRAKGTVVSWSCRRVTCPNGYLLGRAWVLVRSTGCPPAVMLLPLISPVGTPVIPICSSLLLAHLLFTGDHRPAGQRGCLPGHQRHPEPGQGALQRPYRVVGVGLWCCAAAEWQGTWMWGVLGSLHEQETSLCIETRQ